MNWKKILSLAIVSILVFSVLVSLGTPVSADEPGEPVNEVSFDTTLEMSEGAAAAAEGNAHIFMHAVDGDVYQGLPSDILANLDHWEVFGGYNPWLINPAHEGNGTSEALAAVDEGWIDDTDEINYLAHSTEEGWTVNPFACNDFRFSLQYLDRVGMIEDLLDGFGEPRWGSFLSSSDLWMEEFYPEINEPYGLTGEGNEDLMWDMLEYSLENMKDNIAFGEFEGTIGDEWTYTNPDGETHDIEIRIPARVEDWRMEKGYWTEDLMQEIGFETHVEPVDLAGALPMMQGASDEYDNLEWHVFMSGWISTAITAYHHWGNAHMFYPWYAMEPVGHAQPEGHWSYGEEALDNPIGPSDEFREEYELPEERPFETLGDANERSDELTDGIVEDEEEYMEDMVRLESAGVQESVNFFLVSTLDFYPYNPEIMETAVPEAVAGYDTYFGPRTMRTYEEHGWDAGDFQGIIMTGEAQPYMDPWNVYGGSDDVYGEYQRRFLREYSDWAHPQTGEYMQLGNYWESELSDENRLQVFERHGDIDSLYDVEETHDIPEDAVKYVPGEERWMTAEEMLELDPDEFELDYLEDLETDLKVTMDIHDYYQYHAPDGWEPADFDLSHVMFNWARVRELGDEEGPFHSETADLNRGAWDQTYAFEFDEEKGTFTIYGDYEMPVDRLIGNFFSTLPEVHPTTYWGFDYLHDSPDYAYEAGEWDQIHQLIDRHCQDMLDELDEWYDMLPPMLDADNIPEEWQDALAWDLDEWQESIDYVEAFIDEREHAFLSIGPFELLYYDEDDHEMDIQRFEHYGYPQPGESAYDVLERAGIPEDEWDDHVVDGMGDHVFEYGYWTEQFHIEDVDFLDVSAPASVDAGSTFNIGAEATWETLFPEPGQANLEHIFDYRFTIRDSVMGEELLVIGSEDIDAEHLDLSSTFDAFDVLADLPAGEYHIQFEIQVEEGDPWAHEAIPIVFDAPAAQIEGDMEVDPADEIEAGETATITADVENIVDVDAELQIWIDGYGVGEMIHTEMISPGEHTIEVEHTFEAPARMSQIQLHDVGGFQFVDEVEEYEVYEVYELETASTEGGEVVAPGEGTFEEKTTLERDDDAEDDDAEEYIVVNPVVDLAAEAEDGYTFYGWTDDVDGADVAQIADPAAADTEITMVDDHSITAVFEEERPDFVITDFEVDPVEGDIPLEVTITAEIENVGDAEGTIALETDDVEINSWALAPGEDATVDETYTYEEEGVYEVLLGEERIEVVAGDIETFELTINAEDGGTTDPEPDTYTHEEGAEVTVKAIPDEGYVFDEWTGDYEGEDEEITVTMDDDKEITAHFEAEEYELTIDIEGEGTTDPEAGTHSYDYGEEVTVTAEAADGWEFVEWTGDYEGEDEEITITMDDDQEITAHFAIKTYELSVDEDGQGEVEVDPDQEEYDHDTYLDLEAIPEEGWRFVEWEGDYEGTDEEITITMDDDKDITAVFEESTYSLTFEVIDDDDEDVIEDAEIIIEKDGEEWEEETDEDGMYTFTDLEPGTYEWEVSHDDYESEDGEIDLTEDDTETVELEEDVGIPGFTLSILLVASMIVLVFYYKKHLR